MRYNEASAGGGDTTTTLSPQRGVIILRGDLVMSEYEEPYNATPSDKRRIVKDWQGQFPGFHIKGNSMLKIHLPVCVGICIYYGSSSYMYVPTFFINNLATSHYGALNVCQRCSEPPSMSDWWIYVTEHDKMLKPASGWLMENFETFLSERPIFLSEIMCAFWKCLKVGGYSETNVLKDLAYICGYFSRNDEADNYIGAAVDIINTYSSFDQKSVLTWDNVNSVSEWETKMRNECSSPDLLHARVKQRIADAKLDKIPNRPLIVD